MRRLFRIKKINVGPVRFCYGFLIRARINVLFFCCHFWSEQSTQIVYICAFLTSVVDVSEPNNLWLIGPELRLSEEDTTQIHHTLLVYTWRAGLAEACCLTQMPRHQCGRVHESNQEEAVLVFRACSIRFPCIARISSNIQHQCMYDCLPITVSGTFIPFPAIMLNRWPNISNLGI
jgi:hypothetical protein